MARLYNNNMVHNNNITASFGAQEPIRTMAQSWGTRGCRRGPLLPACALRTRRPCVFGLKCPYDSPVVHLICI